jgi:hypothetical protein
MPTRAGGTLSSQQRHALQPKLKAHTTQEPGSSTAIAKERQVMPPLEEVAADAEGRGA